MFRPDIPVEHMEGEIIKISMQFKTITQKGVLGNALAHEVSRYSLLDLSFLSNRFIQNFQYISNPYLEQIRPCLTELFYGTQHQILQMAREKQFDNMKDPITDLKTYITFWDMIPQGTFVLHNLPVPHGEGKEALAIFYGYLIAAFMMFVMDEPGHLVGTPLPGGYIVHKKDEEYICYLRDKEKDVFNSICNYCPAVVEK